MKADAEQVDLADNAIQKAHKNASCGEYIVALKHCKQAEQPSLHANSSALLCNLKIYCQEQLQNFAEALNIRDRKLSALRFIFRSAAIDQSELAWELRNQGLTYIRLFDITKALGCLEESVKLFRSIPSLSKMFIGTLYDIMTYRIMRGEFWKIVQDLAGFSIMDSTIDFDNTLKILKSLDFASNLEDKEGALEIYKKLLKELPSETFSSSQRFLVKSDSEKAVIIDKWRKLDFQFRVEPAKTLKELLNNEKRTVEYTAELLDVAKQHYHIVQRIVILIRYVDIAKHLEPCEEVMIALDECLKLLSSYQRPIECFIYDSDKKMLPLPLTYICFKNPFMDYYTILVYFNKARICYRQTLVRQALLLFEASANISATLYRGDFLHMATLFNLGYIRYQLGEYSKGKENIERLIQISNEENNPILTHTAKLLQLISKKLDTKNPNMMESYNQEQLLEQSLMTLDVSNLEDISYHDIGYHNFFSGDKVPEERESLRRIIKNAVDDLRNIKESDEIEFQDIAIFPADDLNWEMVDIVGDELGEGSYGSVVLVYNRVSREIFAQKIIEISSNGKDKIAKQEHQILLEIKKANNPNLLRIIDMKEDQRQNQFLIVMEYGRHTLFKLIEHLKQKKYKWTDDDLRCLYLQLLSQVHELHYLNICHRDIKPQNIIFTKQGRLKLVDFGFSEVVKDRGEQKMSTKGTKHYMIPALRDANDKREEYCMIDPYKADIHAVEKIMSDIMEHEERNVSIEALLNQVPECKGLKATLEQQVPGMINKTSSIGQSLDRREAREELAQMISPKQEALHTEVYMAVRRELDIPLSNYLRKDSRIIEENQVGAIAGRYSNEEIAEWIDSQLVNPVYIINLEFIVQLLFCILTTYRSYSQKAADYCQDILRADVRRRSNLDFYLKIAEQAFKLNNLDDAKTCNSRALELSITQLQDGCLLRFNTICSNLAAIARRRKQWLQARNYIHLAESHSNTKTVVIFRNISLKLESLILEMLEQNSFSSLQSVLEEFEKLDVLNSICATMYPIKRLSDELKHAGRYDDLLSIYDGVLSCNLAILRHVTKEYMYQMYSECRSKLIALNRNPDLYDTTPSLHENIRLSELHFPLEALKLPDLAKEFRYLVNENRLSDALRLYQNNRPIFDFASARYRLEMAVIYCINTEFIEATAEIKNLIGILQNEQNDAPLMKTCEALLDYAQQMIRVETLERNGEIYEALDVYEDLLSNVQRDALSYSQILTMRRVISVNGSLGLYRKAVELCDEQLLKALEAPQEDIKQEAGLPSRSSLLMKKLSLLLASNQTQEAISFYEQEGPNLAVCSGKDLLRIASLYFLRENFSKAISTLEQLNGEDFHEKTQRLHYWSSEMKRVADLEAAKKFKEAQSVCEELVSNTEEIHRDCLFTSVIKKLDALNLMLGFVNKTHILNFTYVNIVRKEELMSVCIGYPRLLEALKYDESFSKVSTSSSKDEKENSVYRDLTPEERDQLLNTLAAYGQVCLEQKNFVEAWTYLKLTFNLRRSSINFKLPQMAQILYVLGLEYGQQNNYEQMCACLELSYNLTQSSTGFESSVEKARMLALLGRGYNDLKNYPKVCLYLQEEYDLRMTNEGYEKDPKKETDTLRILGTAYYNTDELHKASSYLQRSYDVVKASFKPCNPNSEVELLDLLTSVYIRLENCEKVLDCREKSHSLRKTNGLFSSLVQEIESLCDVSLTYHCSGQGEKAYDYLKQHLSSMQEDIRSIDNDKKTKVFEMLGLAFQVIGRYKEARKLLPATVRLF